MRIELDESVRDALRLQWLVLFEVDQQGDRSLLDQEMEDAEKEYALRYEGMKPGQIEELQAARRLYRSIGVDPTKTRPSSEALLRRILKGQGLYRVLPAVDAANLCSLQALLPVGLYDADRISGRAVQVRKGGPDDSYPGIRRGTIHLDGRLALFDEKGPFGNPTADSDRTKITPASRNLLFVYFAPADYPHDELLRHTEKAAATLQRHVGGRRAESKVQSPRSKVRGGD